MKHNHKISIVQESAETPNMHARYQRALRWLQGLGQNTLVRNDNVLPHWIEGTSCFWYERTTRKGKEYRLVDASAASNIPAFDHGALAGALSKMFNKDIDSDNLPIHELDFIVSSSTELCELRFSAFQQRWLFTPEGELCRQGEVPTVNLAEALSPDGQHCVFRRDHNLWLRTVSSDGERALTCDGEMDYAYGTNSNGWGKDVPVEEPVMWSLDGRKVLTVQRDRRQVQSLPVVDPAPRDGSLRPKLKRIKVSLPGDKQVEQAYLLSIDIASGEQCRVDYPPLTPSKNEYHGFYHTLVWWAADSRHAYFIDDGRGAKVVRLLEFDTQTGKSRLLLEERSDTYVNISTDNGGSPKHRFLAATEELIWWSERSDWGHLYLYDLKTGKLKNTITSGEWRVRDVLRIDEARREVWIQTGGRISGRDPYYRDICRVNIDTGVLTPLISSDEDLVVHYLKSGFFVSGIDSVSPCNQYLVVTRTRVDQVPLSLLLDREGKEILMLEEADIFGVPGVWQRPKPVRVLAADDKTELYGALFYPSDFSADKCYPVINMINSAPWVSVVPKASFNSAMVYAGWFTIYCSALAELGFIVLTLDSRGTPLRSKSFQDESYGWIPSAANTEDHAGAIEQLTQRYPYMDKERVGIFTVTGYRSALQNFLERQDLYKVCVQMNLMDNRLIGGTIEGDKYEGADGPSTDVRYPEQLIDNLRGKLLLVGSVNAETYPVTGILRVIDALQKANKNFDQVIVGTTGGINRSVTAYQYRRGFDYLVKHLKGIEPPKEFSFEALKL